MIILEVVVMVSFVVCFFSYSFGRLSITREFLSINELESVLVLAAHQDDEIISSGELLIESARNNIQTKVMFMTCGGESENSYRARLRKSESLAIWNHLGLSVGNLIFADLVQSNVFGPDVNEIKSKVFFEEALTVQFDALPRGSMVVIPADGESHVDHQVLRKLALKVLSREKYSERFDVYECASYNVFQSLTTNPWTVFRHLLSNTPIFSRLFLRLFPAIPKASFVTAGGDVIAMPYDKKRLELKRKLLRMYESENGHLLARLFGYPDELRRLKYSCGSYCDKKKLRYITVDNKKLSASALTAWIFVYSLNAGLSITFLTYIYNAFFVVFGWIISLPVLFLAALSVYNATKREQQVARRFFWLSWLSGVFKVIFCDMQFSEYL